MCRAPLYEDETVAAAQTAHEEEAVQDQAHQAHQAQGTWMTLQEMDLNQSERSMHDHMLNLIDFHVAQYCLTNPMCTYMGTINLHTIPNRERDYNRIEVGAQSLNCHYVIELRDTSRAFRYKFGRIEDIRMMHPMFQGISFFVFRELIDRWDNDTGYMQTVWSHETQLISVQGGDISSLRQYVPRVRMSV
jgi:hypothetical protein